MEKTMTRLRLFSVLLAIVASTMFASADNSKGKCGNNLKWAYDQRKATLTITGYGEMYDYASGSYGAPWTEYNEHIMQLNLPEGLTYVGMRAFKGLRVLPSVNIPSTVTTIGEDAFSFCSSLESITFSEPSQLQCIGLWAFTECSALTSINIPGSVTSIEYDAFFYCENLKDITVNWTDLSGVNTDAGAFEDVPIEQVNLHVPAGTKNIYAAVEPWSRMNILENGHEAVDAVASDPSSVTHKILRNGQVYILRTGNTYTLTGTEIK